MQKRSQNHWQGIDVSHWQGDIDWTQVREAGIRFAFIKATEGSDFIDPCFKTNARQARLVGLKVGFYHFAQFDHKGEVVKEADHFLQTIANIPSDLPHVLDLEVTHSLNKKELSHAAELFLERIKEKTGHSVMLYTNTNMAQHHLNETLKKYPLWIAHYGVVRPRENGIWENWKVFQYSSHGKIPGIHGHVDLDEMVPNQAHHATTKVVNTYKIRKGDTFWALEVKHGYPHGTLQKLNPHLNPRRLAIGQTIRVP